MIRRTIPVLATAAALCVGLWVAGAAETASAVALPRPLRVQPAAAAPVWTVDKAGSRLSFRVGDSGPRSADGRTPWIDGVFRRWDAQIAFDPSNLKASHAVVTVSMASVRTGDPRRDEALPGPDGFDVGRFAKAVFETTSIVAVAPNRYLASGDLTVHGVRRGVSLPFTLQIRKNGRQEVAHMEGRMSLDQGWFGVGPAGAAPAGPQIAVMVRLTARKGR